MELALSTNKAFTALAYVLPLMVIVGIQLYIKHQVLKARRIQLNTEHHLKGDFHTFTVTHPDNHNLQMRIVLLRHEKFDPNVTKILFKCEDVSYRGSMNTLKQEKTDYYLSINNKVVSKLQFRDDAFELMSTWLASRHAKLFT